MDKATRVMVFGTFDVIHEGHLDFFKQARSLAENVYLIISIARDVNVARIKKRLPKYDELARKQALVDLGVANEVVLGSVDDYLAHIKTYQPDIIALGYDQIVYTETLEEDLLKLGISSQIIRLHSYFPEKYKSSIVKQKLQQNSKL